MAEDLGFLGIARQQAAMNGDKRPFGARACIVNRGRGELFARSRFAPDENAGVCGRGLANQLQRLRAKRLRQPLEKQILPLQRASDRPLESRLNRPRQPDEQ